MLKRPYEYPHVKEHLKTTQKSSNLKGLTGRFDLLEYHFNLGHASMSCPHMLSNVLDLF